MLRVCHLGYKLEEYSNLLKAKSILAKQQKTAHCVYRETFNHPKAGQLTAYCITYFPVKKKYNTIFRGHFTSGPQQESWKL